MNHYTNVENTFIRDKLYKMYNINTLMSIFHCKEFLEIYLAQMFDRADKRCYYVDHISRRDSNLVTFNIVTK